tara:strand:- start:101 stop:457 length:357 start_codon:yes stop_codon:yes gene_type:complete
MKRNTEHNQQKSKKFDVSKAKLAIIHWKDAQDGETGWTSIETIKKHQLAPCFDVGWIIEKTEEKIILIGSFCFERFSSLNDVDGSRYTCIPNSWINKIWYLDSPDISKYIQNCALKKT